MRRKKSTRRIAFGFPFGRPFVENIIQGIYSYARLQADWRFTRFPERLNPSLDWLQAWDGDGAFVIVSTSSDAQIAKNLPYPAVNIAAYLPDAGVHTVTMDHREVGRLAALHLIERRFRKFGYYGSDELRFSQLRREGFQRAIEEAGGSCNILSVSSVVSTGKTLMRQQLQLERWLHSLRLPVGIMASTDLRAGMLLETCSRLGLRVPEDIAVIGVDNDPGVCAYTQPPLSSVARNDMQAGEIAARILDDLMAGKTNLPRLITVPPAGVVGRRSTETIAVEDPELASIVAYLQDHVAEQFGVERLLNITGLSRRCLENRCRIHMNITPHALINTLRIEEAKKLLASPNKFPLSKIAARAGFSNLRHFRMAFSRQLKKSPAAYRNGVMSQSKKQPSSSLGER